MNHPIRTSPLLSAVFAVCALSFSSTLLAVDADAALKLAKQNGCLKCHDVEATKDGPAYRDVAAKYKDKDHAESVNRIVEHMTSGEKAKFPDGHEEAHKKIKVKDVEKQKNLAEWILSLPGGTWPKK